MKPAREWLADLAGLPPRDDLEQISGRAGEPTLKVGSVFLHSRYQPREEAARLVDSANLDFNRPIIAIGIGLGYHVLELLKPGARVAVVDPDPGVGKLAIEGLLRDADVLVGLGDPDGIASNDGFRTFVEQVPQILVHPATARIHPGFAEAMTRLIAKTALQAHRLGVAVVGPMYGGSLPIAHYIERGFRTLGHRTLLVDNSLAWDLYKTATEGVKTKHASAQLGEMLGNFLGEWSYARVAEFAPDICIVLAQAPVGPVFPARLAKEGIVTAFWYVENWRHFPYWKDIARFYDVFFHIQPGEFEDQLTQAGCRCHAYVQTGCDPEIHKPVELDESERNRYGCDLSFAGAGYANRVQLFKGLTDYDFKIWGVEWSARELQPLVCGHGERFSPEQFAKIAAGSKINLNLHSSASHEGVDPKCDAINPRVFEIAACGGFQLCDPCISLESLFDFDSELPVYRSLPELRARIDYFLAHDEERREYAGRARVRALRDHTYAKRAQQMLDVIVERYGATLLQKGIRIQRTMAETADRVGRETGLGRYLASLPPDVFFTQENVNNLLTKATSTMSYPEKVFAYLREVRSFAETLLAMRS